jgi:cytochrome c oxidase assembly protein subunit 15
MDLETPAAQKRFAWFAWTVLAFNIPTILWGAYVRVSYSGDGCGAHWPFCNGQALPQKMTAPTIIEFTHRMMTGVDMVLVIALVALAFLVYPTRHIVRRYATASLAFLLVEAALGAGLVLFRMVARDQSVGRVWYLSAHLTNTMLMLGTMTLTAWLARSGVTRFKIRDSQPGVLWAAAAAVLVSITGAVTALGDTLFPAGTLMEGMRRDLASESPLLLRLRVAHPAIAVIGAGVVIWTALNFWRGSSSEGARKAAMRVVWLCGLQLFAGAMNLSLLAPVWMQLTHLFIGDVLWIAMTLLVAESAVSENGAYILEAISASGRETAAGKPA